MDEDEEGEEIMYNLIILTLPESMPEELPAIKNLYSFIEKHGQRVPGGYLSFKEKECVRFFDVIQQETGKDLLLLLGATVYERPEDEGLCCGVLPTEQAKEAIEELKKCLEEGNKKKELEKKAIAAGFDFKYFFERYSLLFNLLSGAINQGGAIMGLFE